MQARMAVESLRVLPLQDHRQNWRNLHLRRQSQRQSQLQSRRWGQLPVAPVQCRSKGHRSQQRSSVQELRPEVAVRLVRLVRDHCHFVLGVEEGVQVFWRLGPKTTCVERIFSATNP